MKALTRIGAALILVVAGYGSYAIMAMVLDRNFPISYVRAEAISSTVPAGGNIDVEFEVFRTRICKSTLQRFLTDASGTKHAITNFTVGTGTRKGTEVYRRSITVPDTAAVGPAYYEISIEFRCTPLERLWPLVMRYPDIPRIPFTITSSLTNGPFNLNGL